jgi:hypothetical protein
MDVLRGVSPTKADDSGHRQDTNAFSQLLTKAPSDRFGCGQGGISNLKKHSWFRGIDWQAMVQKTAIPPFKPNVRSKKKKNCWDTLTTLYIL